MNQKFLKVVAAVVAFGLIAGLAWFANGLLGNPYSQYQANKTAENHLKATYPNTDFYIEDVSYNFKNGGYYATIDSPSSIDSYFTLRIGMNGKLIWDGYETQVLNKENTAQRLDREYRQLVDTALEDSNCPHQFFISFGRLEFYQKDYLTNDIPSYALPQEDLELDQEYDIAEMGAKIGNLILYVESDTVSTEAAANIMVEIKEYLDSQKVTFRAMTFVLQHPSPEEGPRPEGQVQVQNFLYEDIYKDGMQQRVEQADREYKEFLENLDKKY